MPITYIREETISEVIRDGMKKSFTTQSNSKFLEAIAMSLLGILEELRKLNGNLEELCEKKRIEK